MSKTMTRKQMEEHAAKLGESVEYIFQQGLHCLESSKQSLSADRDNPVKFQIDRIIRNMNDTKIAENILREWYGIQFCQVDTHGGHGLTLQVYCGIAELGKMLGQTPEEEHEWRLFQKKFMYDDVTFIQLADTVRVKYKPAFAGSVSSKYSTTYEQVYDENGEIKK